MSDSLIKSDEYSKPFQTLQIRNKPSTYILNISWQCTDVSLSEQNQPVYTKIYEFFF